MNVDEFAAEMWTRTLVETMELDSDIKYIVRGIVQSVLHDMKETPRDDEAGT